MIKGLGTDLIEVDRIKKAIEKHGDVFLKKLFTENERAYFKKFEKPLPVIAGRYAAMEAVAKALGCGIGEKLAFHDFEIVNEKSGKPFVRFSEKAKATFDNPQMHISISHLESFAMATAVWV